ncbi:MULTISPECIES: hypothetical protein [Arcanobacterium]|nr:MULTISPECIES: hypothetical protein [Arcanobacterium]
MSSTTDALKELNLDSELIELTDQDDHWHFITCGIIIGSGGC